MKNKNYFKIAIAVVLCLAMVLPFVPIQVEAAVGHFPAIGSSFDNVKISILGDGISTFDGVSNDTNASAGIDNNAPYYPSADALDVDSVSDTWWQQTVDTLGLDLLVNNSWSGSYVTKDGGDKGTDGSTPEAAWKARSKQLHSGTTEPQIVAVYMGTNDIKDRLIESDGTISTTDGFTTLYSDKGVLNDTIVSEGTGSTTEFTRVLSAYLRMVNNILVEYENAEVYLFTLLPNWSQPEYNLEQLKDFNDNIRDVVKYYQEDPDNGNRVFLVDLYEDSGITSDLNILETYMADCLHPNALGMDAITNCFVSSLLKNSKYSAYGDQSPKSQYYWKNVTYDLDDAYVVGGNINVARYSTSKHYGFSIELLPTRPEYDLDVKVERWDATNSKWVDITATYYSGGTVYIKDVEWDLKITAKGTYNTHNYRWEWNAGELKSATVDGSDYNIVGDIDSNNATVLYTDGYGTDGRWTHGTNEGTQFSLNDSIVLRNDNPWVVEWKDTRYWGYGGALFSEADSWGDANSAYLYKGSNQGPDGTEGTGNDDNLLAFGYYNNYRNWNIYVGAPLDKNTKAATYRLVNEVTRDSSGNYVSNMPYVYADYGDGKGFVLEGALNQYYFNGTELAGITPGGGSAVTTDNWISGRDFVFPFLGAEGKALAGVKLEYLQIWEGGEFDTLRMDQLLEEEFANGIGYTSESYALYQTAINAAKNYKKDKTNSQDTYDNFVKAINDARNQLVLSEGSGKIISAELLTGEFARNNKQVGLRIITDPNVAKLEVGTRDLIVCTSQIQKMQINGTDTMVKVWLVTFRRTTEETKPDDEKTVDYAIKAFDRDGNQTHSFTKSVEYLTYDYLNVSDLADIATGETVKVEGYFVGVADEGSSSDKEMLFKDIHTDDIIAVRNVPVVTAFPDYGYAIGDKLVIEATLSLDGTAYTPNKRYLDYGSIKLISSGNDITYQLNNTVKVSSWAEMQDLFATETISDYTYIEFTGPLYFHKNVSTQGDCNSYRLYMDASATGASEIRPDGSRAVALRDNVMIANIGDEWKDLFFDGEISTTSYPGATVNGTLVALYTGGNSTYYQLTVLDESWLNREYVNEEILTEVAYAYYNQGTAIQYDQTQKRRNMNPSPEDATAQNPIYLDCSSYVNALYNEAFGVNVMPYALSVDKGTPTTERYTTYAKDNAGKTVDAIGYWENADYTNDADIEAVLSEVKNQLQVGDVLVYRHGEDGSSGHVFVYVGNDTFLHCSGASYVYNEATPSESYDYGTLTETTKGAIQIIDSDSIFTSTGDQSSKRYLFNGGDDPVVNFSLLRPLARGLKPTRESINRMKIAGLEAEKSVDVGQYNSVCPGDTLVYAVTLTNNSGVDVTNVSFKDTLPSSVAVMYGSEGVNCSGQNVTWTGTVKAGKTVTLTYTVKVSESATAGTVIESNQATVCGVKINDLTNTVSAMGDSELAAIAEAAKSYVGTEFGNPIDFVHALYEGAIDNSYDTVTKVRQAVIDKENTTYRTDTVLSEMLVPNLYGGLIIKDGYYTDCDRARLVIEDYLEVGDVIIASYNDSKNSCVYVYVGDGQMVYIDNTEDTCKLVDIGNSNYYEKFDTTSNRVLDNILATLISYEYYAILRPSMAA